MSLGDFAPGDLISARGREWVVLPSPGSDAMRVRPLSGSEDDAVTILPSLENIPIRSANFKPPTLETLDTQDAARLLSDALRLSLRRGAGPFRSSANLGVEPRAYQLVPLMMALKLNPVRLLIADDVGIGKTIEAGMILRELLDRGRIDRFAVLCPPHLVDQWVTELSEKFDIDAAAVTSSRARSLERGLPASQSLFNAYPYTVVSLDYIKSERRRNEFARACPNLIITDEAHTCVGGGNRGKQLRYELLKKLSEDKDRNLLLLTATPHSGDEAAFDRLLGLIDPELGLGAPPTTNRNARERYQAKLAQHYVQRRRPDIEEGGWIEHRAFPTHLETEFPYKLSGESQNFQEDVLDYCLGVTERAGESKNKRRMAFWSTLALMRCVGSSPAAALSALRNRRKGLVSEELIEPVIFDEEDGLADDGDLEPATALENIEVDEDLSQLIEQAAVLHENFAKDPKVVALEKLLRPMLKEGQVNPVIFCRFIATAKALGEILSKKYGKKYTVLTISGELTPEERKARIDASESDERRILVATDCLSEGINLQSLFNAVIHYDLSWNPTRHQQREGRVDRFGQPSDTVFSATLFGENSPIDGAVLKVILEKAKAIKKATGIAVPMPEDTNSVGNALMQAMLLRKGGTRAQGLLDLFGGSEERIEAQWKDSEEGAKASRARYAQGALKPEVVIPEWKAMRALNGGPKEVERFVRRASQRFGAALGKKGDKTEIYLDEFPENLKEKLSARKLSGSKFIRFQDDPKPGQMYVGRVHPIVANLAQGLTEAALDPKSSQLGARLGRCGAWRTPSVELMTTVLLLRLRFKLTSSGRSNRLLLAEEATSISFTGTNSQSASDGFGALALLEAEASGEITGSARERRLVEALDRTKTYDPAIKAYALSRAATLQDDHHRLTDASKGGSRIQVEPSLPADIIGLYVLLPEIS